MLSINSGYPLDFNKQSGTGRNSAKTVLILMFLGYLCMDIYRVAPWDAMKNESNHVKTETQGNKKGLVLPSAHAIPPSSAIHSDPTNNRAKHLAC